MTSGRMTIAREGHLVLLFAVANFGLSWLLVSWLVYSPSDVGWVGAGHGPRPTIVNVAFLPAALSAVLGLYVITRARHVRRRTPIGDGIAAVLAGVVQFLGVAFAIGMTPIW